MLISIHPETPQPRLLQQVVDCLQQGGIVAYPTDTIYGLGCDIHNKQSLERLYRLKERSHKTPFSFICNDISQIAEYAAVSNRNFKILKRQLPGPYTFILEATRQAPALLASRRRTVGVRIPDHPIPRELVRLLGRPIVTTSANRHGEEPWEDPSLIAEDMAGQVDMVIEAGICRRDPSTVISLVGDQLEVLRSGSGPTDWIVSA